MSRSPIQDAILAECVAGRERHDLKWAVARRTRNVPPEETVEGSGSTEAELTRSFKTSFNRALKSLQKHGRIEVTAWNASSFSELAPVYALKTDSTLVQRMRRALLPVLVRSAKKKPSPRIGTSDLELRRVRLHPIGEATLQRWNILRGTLQRLVGTVDAKEAYALASVLIATEQLAKASVDVGRDWAEIIARADEPVLSWTGPSLHHCIEALERPESSRPVRYLGKQLRAMYDEIVPKSEHARAGLKNELYEFVEDLDRGTGQLKEDALALLHREDPKTVESLPGHVTHPPDRLGERHTYSPYLRRQLLNKIALRRFERVAPLGQP